MLYEITPYLYEEGGTTVIAFDAKDEVQALTWAAGDMYRGDSGDPEINSAYLSAYQAYRDSVSDREGIVLRDANAHAMISVLKRWVEAGPPRIEGQATDAARMKSYRTACALVARIVEAPNL